MVTVKIFGTTPPCAKCKRAEREARKAAEEFPGQVEVQKLDALGREAEAFGMIVTPTVVVNGEVVGSGRVVPAERLVAHIRSMLGA
jgi:protein-disulfide isomerase